MRAAFLLFGLITQLGACGDDDCCTQKHDAGPDAPPYCGPTMKCSDGNQCGTNCCNVGEWCVPNTSTCRCGSGPACLFGDTCATAGPIGPDPCGSVCCGPTSGMPCPL